MKLKRIKKGWYQYEYGSLLFFIENGTLAELCHKSDWLVTVLNKKNQISRYTDTVSTVKEARLFIKNYINDYNNFLSRQETV